MIKVTIQKIGKDLKQFPKNFDAVWPDFQDKANELGLLVKKDFDDTIASKVKRKSSSSGNLARNIEFYPLNAMGILGFGVGKIEHLNIHAEYWYWVNYGTAYKSGIKTPGDGKFVPFGHFAPGIGKPCADGFRSGRWVTANVGSEQGWRFKAQLDMPKMNYIEDVTFRFGNRLQKLFAELKTIIDKRIGR